MKTRGLIVRWESYRLEVRQVVLESDSRPSLLHS